MPLLTVSLFDCYQTLAPRSLMNREQGEDIVCARRNAGGTCDVGSSHPGAGAGPKGWAVRPLKRHASWVQNVVRQFGLYPLQAFSALRGAALSTRGPAWTARWWSSCGTTRRLRSYGR